MGIKIIDNKSANTMDAKLFTNDINALKKINGEGTSAKAWLDGMYESNIGQIGIINCIASGDSKGFRITFYVNPPFRGVLAKIITEFDGD